MNIRQILVVLLLFFLISGCTSRDIKREELAGQWNSTDGARLIFKNDGTFTALNVPHTFFGGTPIGKLKSKEIEKNRINSNGNWIIRYISNYSIVLETRSINGKSTEPHSQELVPVRQSFLDSGGMSALQLWLDSDGVDIYEFTKEAATK